MNIPEVFHTEKGTTYLKECGVALLAKTHPMLSNMQPFLESFDESLGFCEYLEDQDKLDAGEDLIKAAGQLCYLSLGSARTFNKDAQKYFKNILQSGHLSVVEHVSVTFLFYGISRSNTHELVRHRLSSFSQCSQRYVGGSTLRFVERPEFQNHPKLHKMFEHRIDRLASEYEEQADILMDEQANNQLSGTEARKAVRQSARACLPNETEAPIIVTTNLRSWRHFLDLRATPHAEPEIRALAVKVGQKLQAHYPNVFGDYEQYEHNGSACLKGIYK